MFKKAVTYDNLFDDDGSQPRITEVLHFHLYLAQIIELDLQAQAQSGDPEKGLAWLIDSISKSNGAAIMAVFKNLIKASYGVREGDQFIQTDVASEKFIRSAAFDAFLQLLLTDNKMASKFINGIMPRELLEQADRTIKDGSVVKEVALPEYPPKGKATEEELRLSGLDNPLDDESRLVPWWDREPTHAEQQAMSQAQLMEVFKRKSSGWTPRGA